MTQPRDERSAWAWGPREDDPAEPTGTAPDAATADAAPPTGVAGGAATGDDHPGTGSGHSSVESQGTGSASTDWAPGELHHNGPWSMPEFSPARRDAVPPAGLDASTGPDSGDTTGEQQVAPEPVSPGTSTTDFPVTAPPSWSPATDLAGPGEPVGDAVSPELGVEAETVRRQQLPTGGWAASPGYAAPDYGQQPDRAAGEYAQPDYSRSGYNQAEYRQIDYSQSDHNQPEYNQPEYNRPEYDQPEYDQPGYDQPGYSQPGYNQPGYNQPGYGQPGAQPDPYQAPPPPADAHPLNQPADPAPAGYRPQGGPPQPYPPQPTPSAGFPAPAPQAPGRHQPGSHAQPPAPNRPVPRPEDLLRPAGHGDERASAARGWRGRVNRMSGGMIKAAPDAAEQADRQARRDLTYTAFSGPKTVVVVQPKGGAGKTPTTIGIASALGVYRGGYVVGWDDNETRGTLGVRVKNLGAQGTTVWDLLENLDEFENPRAEIGRLAHFVRGQGEAQFDALVSDESPDRMEQINAEAFERIHRVLKRFYRFIVVDTGNNVRSSNWQAAVEAADLVVVVSTYRRDVGFSGSWVLDHLTSTGREQDARRAITVLTAADPTTDPEVRRELVEHFGRRTRQVVEIPYDPLIALGGAMEWGKLRPATQDAWTRAGAAVVNALADADRAAQH